MQEFRLIEKIFKPLTNQNKAAQGLADDAARIALKKDEELVISKDIFVENVHFLFPDGGFKIAAKLLRANLSDLAASGAKPRYYMLGFSKNDRTDEKFLKEFVAGLKSVQDEFGLDLIGGDTIFSEQLFFSITIFGTIKKGKALCRNHAQNDDLIFVSGTIGDAFLGLTSLQKKISTDKTAQALQSQHFLPTPRIKLSQALLAKNLSKCAIDVSDGLLADLNHISTESKLDAEIYLEEIPFSQPARDFLDKNPEIKKLDLLSGGDDYELIFTAKNKDREKIFSLGKKLKLNLSCIGKMKKPAHKNPAISLFDKENKKIKITKFGYEH